MKKYLSVLFVDFYKQSGSPAGLISELGFIKKNYAQLINPIVVCLKGSIIEKKCHQLKIKAYTINKKNINVEFDYYPNFLTRLKNKSLAFLSVFFFCLKIALKHKVRIIHCNHYMWSHYINPLGLILRKHVFIHLKDVFILKPKIKRILLKLNPNVTYIAVSQYVKLLFIKKYKLNEKKTIVLYDGIDEKIFTNIKVNKLKQKIKKDKKIIVMMSRVIPERDIEIFIDVAGLAKKYGKLKNVFFYHYGLDHPEKKSAYFKELKKRVSVLGIEKNFKFIPYIKEKKKVVQVFKKAFLCLVPARQYALPNIAIESMMSGTPVVLRNIGGNPEIVKNKKFGQLTTSSSPLEFYQAIKFYLSNPQKYLSTSKKASKFAQQTFAGSQIYKKLVNLYYKQV